MRTDPAADWFAAHEDIELAVRSLIDLHRVPPTPATIHLAEQVAMHAYERGRHDALMGLRTTAEVAAILGLTPARVTALARKLGIGWDIDGRSRLYRDEDLAALRNRPVGQPGRPRKGNLG